MSEPTRTISTRAATKSRAVKTNKAPAKGKEPIRRVKDGRVKKSTPGNKLSQVKAKTPAVADQDDDEETNEESHVDPEQEECTASSKERAKPQKKSKKKSGWKSINGKAKWHSMKRDYDTTTAGDVAEEERREARRKLRVMKARKTFEDTDVYVIIQLVLLSG